MAPEYLTPRLERWRRRTDAPLLALAVGSLPILLLDFARHRLAPTDLVFVDAVNLVVLVAFSFDYLVELALARKRSLFIRREWTSALIVVGQLAALVPALFGFGALRVLRAAPAVRSAALVLRALAVGGAAAMEGRSLFRRHAVGFALGLAALTWISAAVVFTLVEDVGRDGRIRSFFDALWWATTTVTTVGYGDVYPVSLLGRLTAAFTMLVGISTFSIVTAKLAELLLRSRDEPEIIHASDTGSAQARKRATGDAASATDTTSDA